ncbi:MULTISPECIES: DUF4291 domain-containing protein [unclassified Variovorax]|uniref:DUF4291 domain-containing protein n=1 Tax=unclassified Variovorax TaxID=663243 RepID=UPI0008C7CB46|nr:MULTISPECIES: DUF4291 domain-containing protein [unclassified Variovorax]SEJ44965.1 protein of unknown function [Variovorax sp. OK202]SFC44391.1 protein of unknown function [Variovorax sp. OK212]
MNDAVTPLPTERHIAQRARWPKSGQHILAHHDAHSVVVYQAYRPEIGEYAIRHGRLDGPAFSLSRMSWIKPNFLWMMYRSGWGTKEGQEVTLGLRLRRAFFERVVREAVPSTFNASQAGYPSREAWQEAVGRSEVRLQWDPDHSPRGGKLERRAIQLGLRGRTLAAFAHEELLEVIDMRAFVDTQRPLAQDDDPALQLPVEHVLDIGT